MHSLLVFYQLMAVILQTNDVSGRTRAKISSVSVHVSLSSSRLKTGIRRIMRREAPYALMCLQRRTKAFTACGRIMRLNA